jgi:hypothetical protein
LLCLSAHKHGHETERETFLMRTPDLKRTAGAM